MSKSTSLSQSCLRAAPRQIGIRGSRWVSGRPVRSLNPSFELVRLLRLAKICECDLRDGILTGLHVGNETVIGLPQRRHDFHLPATLPAEADIARVLGVDEEIADMRARYAQVVGHRREGRPAIAVRKFGLCHQQEREVTGIA